MTESIVGDHSPLLTRQEVCRILRVHRDTLRRWNLSGKLRAVRIGSRGLRYRSEDLAQVLRSYDIDNPSKTGPKPRRSAPLKA
jgi:excisionase family DNA binding protein